MEEKSNRYRNISYSTSTSTSTNRCGDTNTKTRRKSSLRCNRYNFNYERKLLNRNIQPIRNLKEITNSNTSNNKIRI